MDDKERPVTAATTSSQNQADITTQAASVFEDEERSVRQHPFKAFYTTGEPVQFKSQNRFEGRSNYYHYYPTDDVVEQKIEKIWAENANRQVQEKRRDEELKQNLKEWSDARARIEGEIQRKKEHLQVGTNFEKARGFVRSDWKTKNFNPEHNPLEEESSEEDYGDEEYEDEEEAEQPTEIIQEDLGEDEEGYDTEAREEKA